MKKMFLLAAVLCGMSVSGVRGASFEELRALASGRRVTLPSGTFVEGVVISDYASRNMEVNPNVSAERVDLGASYRTAYLQSPDGKYGMRLVFDKVYCRLPKTARVRVDLTGATLCGETDPPRYTVSGLSVSRVEVLEESTVLPVKRRHIAQLTDEDIYTYVTLEGVEMASRQGAYTNVFEPAVQRSWLNEYKIPSEATDSWASMLMDDCGDHIYMLVNTLCTWRRRGGRVPQGIGDVDGVLVHSRLRRYGGDIGRYAIRPAGPHEIRIGQRDTVSSYLTVTEWNWDRNYECALNLERQGLLTWVSFDTVDPDRILPDIGKGFLSTTVNASLRVDPEWDARNAQDGSNVSSGMNFGEGRREYGAVCFCSDVKDWYRFEADGRAIPSGAVQVEASTKGFRGKSLHLDLSWIAGRNQNYKLVEGFPACWTVSCSLDGEHYRSVPGVLHLRPMYYNEGRVKKRLFRLSYDAAMGFTEHTVVLPPELMDRERVFIRISPASDVLTLIPEDPAADIEQGKMTPDYAHAFRLEIGKVSLKVLK